MSDDDALRQLADSAGVSPHWRDVHGQEHAVSPDTLRAVLGRLGLPAGSAAQVRETRERLREAEGRLPPLLTAVAGEPAGAVSGRARVFCEDGSEHSATGHVPPIDVPGYHRLETGDGEHILAVAPSACRPPPPGRPWGLAVQLYGLRRAGDGGIGDFPALAEFARGAAAQGADAVAISPVHAQFSADPERFSPYAPSSRIMLNVLHAAPAEGDAALEALPLVDWPAAARARVAGLRRAFARHDAGSLSAYRRERGDALEWHARFEALHAHFYAREPGLWHWRNWPEGFSDPRSPAVEQFAREHADEIAFHAWLQQRAEAGLQDAQDAARAAGMRIGLISDLAVGTDGGGSHAWMRQEEMLIGLSIGAPPDAFNARGQDWGLTAFSPGGMLNRGYAAFLEMLRAALRHAGGVRIDHVMGLERLWVLPEGAAAAEGAYLRFPVQDLLRLVALESHRHGAVVVGEDLGTVPHGFQPKLMAAGLLGMRVLWFERDGESFRPPGRWSREAAAMTGTHDLPTVAGWWRGRDIDWRERLHLTPDAGRERDERVRDRGLLWQAMRDSGAAQGDAPSPENPHPVVDAAAAHVAGANCALAILPLEDVLGLEEQPNLPGTVHEHPNWRRRLPAPAGALLDQPGVAGRLAAIRRARS